MKVLKFDLRDAYENGVTEHPQHVMKDLGYKVTKMRGEPMGDCVFFEVENIIEPLPVYLTESNYKFEF